MRATRSGAFLAVAVAIVGCSSSSNHPTTDASTADDAASGAGDDAASSEASSDAAPAEAEASDAAPSDAPSLPHITVWLAGDSLVENYVVGNAEGDNGADLEGWGQEIAPFFTNDVSINNQAIGGRSVADFIYQVLKDDAGAYECIDDAGDPLYQLDATGNKIDPSQWSRIKGNIVAGDYLLIEFGTNDETHTCPRYVTTDDFETDLGIMVDAVRAKGATPIFITPPAERAFNADGTVDNILSDYVAAMKAEATIKSVEVGDLNTATIAYYESVGDAFLTTNIFDTGTTHYVKAGAIEMASLVAGQIRANAGPLASYLLPQ